MRKIIARDRIEEYKLKREKRREGKRRTGSNVVRCATELLDRAELLGGESLGDVELDTILEDGLRKLRRIRRGVGLEEELSRHSGWEVEVEELVKLGGSGLVKEGKRKRGSYL